MLFGENEQEELAGSPEQEKVTAELNPSSAVTESMKVAGWPAEMVKVVGLAAKEKAAVVGCWVWFAVMAANKPCCSLFRPAVKYKVLGLPVCPLASKSSSQREAL